MPHICKWEEKGLYRKFTDKVLGEEILRLNLAQQGDPRFDEIIYVINDFTQIVDFDINDRDVKKISAVDNIASRSNPNIRVAIVSTFKPLLEWIESYCEAMVGTPNECEIFSNVNDAYKWASCEE